VLRRMESALAAQRDAMDDAFLTSPIGPFDSVKYRAGQNTRIAELDPCRGAGLFRQLADQIATAVISA
jgi:hypothetical protein